MAFTSNRIFFADPRLIAAVADELAAQFEGEGYTVQKHELLAGDAEISITKGGVFKAVAGLKTALKITLRQEDNHIKAEAGVGIFGQQAVPTVISMLFFWPVLVTQIWGMIEQSKLDDHALDLIAGSLERLQADDKVHQQAVNGSFCPACGAHAAGKFCSECGAKLG